MSGLPDGWFETTIEEVAEIHNVSRIPLSTKQRSKKQGAYPYYGASGIIDYIDEYIFDGEYVLISEDGENLNTRKTPIAFKANGKFWVNNHAHIVKGLDSYLNDYLVYYLKNTNLSPYITGAAQPKLSKSNLLSIPFILPENKNEQKSIANILSSFDEKIELLREQNEILETLAQTIFKEWFVNFNYPDATGEMEGSELGDIPKGWRVGKLGDEFNITIGRTPPRKESHWFSKTPIGKKWSSIKDMVNSGTYIFKTSEFITDEAINKFNIPVIPENTVILSFKMTVGKLAITTEDMLSNEAIAHMKVIKGTCLTSEYIYLFLHGLDFNSLGSTSSIVTAINSTMIKQIQFLIPKDRVLKNFDEIIKPIFEKIKHNTSQIQTLTKTRDTLLPKLMSGKVRVKGVEV